MTSLERIEHARPDELARLLHTVIRWLRDEWFRPSLDDPSLRQLVAAMGAADRQQLAELGTPYLRERLDLLAELVDDVTHNLRNPAADAREASLRWSAVDRRGLALVVDLYEQAAVRNAHVRDLCERAGWDIEPPGLLLSETTEDAITLLYEGLQRAAGLLEAAARTHGSGLPAGVELLEREFAHARSDDDRFEDAYRRAWGPARPRGRSR